ncbi:Leucine aminopeptidase A [Fusarium oxysporum f. sp. albedinis]|nr:Leucine aminopeptidase A [Fusarium oxysporum f. sp. albedinis]KAK2484205.1 hypothetical protein H9L39_05997 [Fusarium oxysporum f. sp. albedinis]
MLITARKIAREVIWQCTRRQARPLFFWAVANDKNELVVMHPEIDSWKSNTKERYEEQKKRHPEYGRDALVIHALTRYYAIEGKILKHAIRVASWQPPNEIKGHLESFNETALAHPLGGMLDGRFYGPIVAFIYHLDPEFNYSRMSTADFRHVVDIFQNSMWNPMIGDVDRYPGKAVSALLMPDPATTGYITKDGEAVGGDCNNRLGTHEPIVEVNIPTMINFRQTCWHTYSGEEGSALRQLCVTGITWDSFLLGPLLLELPWIGLAKADKAELDCSKKEFSKLWNELQKGKTKILNEEQEHEDFDFANASSPYDGPTNTESVLTKETSKAFLHTHISNGPKKDARKRLAKEEFEQFMKLLRPYLEK